MSKNLVLKSAAIVALGLCSCLAEPDQTDLEQSEQAATVPGAIFTTLTDGSAVNENLYDAKADVYLNGGPGPNAPVGAAGLPAGDYYFQVTNPNGAVLLSEDAIQCRRVTVNAAGVISAIVPGTQGGTACQHAQGTLAGAGGAITVQLIPFLNTPNPGGEYKVWMTPVGEYHENSGSNFGFVESKSKTDNFKVREEDVVKDCDLLL